MQLTVALDDRVFPLDVTEDLEVENLKAFCEAETGIPAGEMAIIFEGKALVDDKKSITSYGIKNGDAVYIQRKPKKQPSLQLPDFSQIRLPGAAGPSHQRSPPNQDDPQYIKEMLQKNPEQLAMLRQNNPRLADAFDSGNLEDFANVLKEQMAARAERERQRLRMLTADPFDMEAQKLIAQEIENKNIDQNMELAMEHNPESFATVIMLYIDCKVNGHPIKAFVDSGAQATIMSRAAAERCGIMRLVDRRYAGIAKGVGVQKIIGRVHMAQIQIRDSYLTSSLSILEEQPMDMLLGLDMLKRHQCSIDLKRNVLVIGTNGTETPFLPESELPECARLSTKMQNLEEALKASASTEEEKLLKEALARSEADAKRLKNSDGQSASTSSLSTGILPTDTFTEEDIQTLMKYGFERAKCIEELRLNNGDMKQATAALFAKSLKF